MKAHIITVFPSAGHAIQRIATLELAVKLNIVYRIVDAFIFVFAVLQMLYRESSLNEASHGQHNKLFPIHQMLLCLKR